MAGGGGGGEDGGGGLSSGGGGGGGKGGGGESGEMVGGGVGGGGDGQGGGGAGSSSSTGTGMHLVRAALDSVSGGHATQAVAPVAAAMKLEAHFRQEAEPGEAAKLPEAQATHGDPDAAAKPGWQGRH